MQARCPHCQNVFGTDRTGIQFCPNCGQQINVPAPAAAPGGFAPQEQATGSAPGSSARAGANCAQHPDQAATGTCERCGNFTCSLCSDPVAPGLCPACRERTGAGAFPLRRDNYDFGALWDYCFNRFKREWLMLSVAVLILTAASFAVSLVSGGLSTAGKLAGSQVLEFVLTVVGAVAQYAIQGALTLGMMRMIFDVLDGRTVNIGALFSQFRKTGRYLLALLVIFVIIFIPVGLLIGVAAALGAGRGGDESVIFIVVGVALLAVIPLIYALLPLAFISPELAFNDEASALGALRNCYVIGRERRLSTFVVLLVSGGLGMLGMLACCIGILPAIALGQLLLAGLYRALRRGTELET